MSLSMSQLSSNWTFFADHREEIFSATLDHLVLVLIAMIIAILIGVPLGMFIVQRPALRAIIDRAVLESAEAMGMTRAQILFRVRFPLALAVILAGIRTATIITIGVATIAAAIGAGGLGTFIFRAVALFSDSLILAGAVPAALLALLADFLLGLLERKLKVSWRSPSPLSLCRGRASARRSCFSSSSVSSVLSATSVLNSFFSSP